MALYVLVEECSHAWRGSTGARRRFGDGQRGSRAVRQWVGGVLEFAGGRDA